MKPELPILFSPKQASAVLGISRTTLYEQMRLGHLGSLKLGRSRKFTQEHMQDFIKHLEIKA